MVGNIVKILPLQYEKEWARETKKINTAFVFYFPSLTVLVRCTLLNTSNWVLSLFVFMKTAVKAFKYYSRLCVLTLPILWLKGKVTGPTCARRDQRQQSTHTPVQLLVADILHPCLRSLKNDRKQRKRGGKACLTVDKPQRLPLNTVWQTRTKWFTKH